MQSVGGSSKAEGSVNSVKSVGGSHSLIRAIRVRSSQGYVFGLRGGCAFYVSIHPPLVTEIQIVTLYQQNRATYFGSYYSKDSLSFVHEKSSCSVRRPIGFRPPPDRIPSAARSDSVRRPL